MPVCHSRKIDLQRGHCLAGIPEVTRGLAKIQSCLCPAVVTEALAAAHPGKSNLDVMALAAADLREADR